MKQRNKIIYIFTLLMFVSLPISAKGKKNKNVKTKVIDQKIDLGAISVEGEVITPEDLTIDDDSEQSTLELYRRKTYKDQLNINLQSIF